MGDAAREIAIRAMHNVGSVRDIDLTGPVDDETDLKVDMGYDSLDFVELAMEIEDQTLATVADEAFAEWRTIGDVIRFVEALTYQDN